MTALMIIFGVLMILGGIACFATPVATTLGLLYVCMIFLFCSGIIFLIMSIAYRRLLDFIIAILALLAGGFIIFNNYAALVVETIILFIAAAWLIIRGIIGMVNAIRAKSQKAIGGGFFALALIVSIIVIIAGICFFVNPGFFAAYLGIMAGIFFVVEGIDLIVAGCIGSDLKKMSQ